MGNSQDVSGKLHNPGNLETSGRAHFTGIRKAKASDALRIQDLINTYAKEGLLLPRALGEIYDNIRDFFVYEEDGRIQGVCALHVCWEDLAELRSLAVQKESRGKGVGEALIKAALKEASELGIKRVFLLTYIPAYFKRFGFGIVPKEILPQKIWGDCLKCVKFPNCDEIAMMLSLSE